MKEESKCAAVMPCGAVVTNVYDAYEAGKKSALAKQEQGEPVAWCVYCDGQFNLNIFQVEDVAHAEKARLDYLYPQSKRKVVPLYTTPQQRTWVGLSVFEINDLVTATEQGLHDLVERTEAKLNEKNT